MKKTKKFLSILILFTILFSNFSNVFALSIFESKKVNLIFDHDCVSVLKIKGQNILKQVAYVCYKDPDTGIKYPAFCVEPAKDGIGTGAGNSYDVTLTDLSNPILWRMLYKGYVGTSYKDWNLECDDDLYFATKTAIHCFADGSTPTSKYEIPHRVGYGDNVTLEDVQRRGTKVLEASQAIYDYGYNSTDNYIKAEINIIKKRDLYQSTINNINYLIQNYYVTSNKELSSYNVNISNFPDGTLILNSSNNNSNLMTNPNFKIAIPIEKITKNFEGIINVTNAKVKSYPIFYADSGNASTQNYVIADSSEIVKSSTTLNIDAYKSGIKILKIDNEKNTPLKGVTFNIKYADGTNIGDYTTDASGNIFANKLKQGKIVITEKSTLNEYILDTTPYEVNLKYGEIENITIENKFKKGNLKIIKIDKDNNEIRIPNVEFELLDNNKNLINTYKTDKNGEIFINNLNIGNYYLREIEESNSLYTPLKEDIKVTINWNETTTKFIKNELKKGQIKIIKVDKDNNEIKLEGVTFEILDSNKNIIEELITDKNGEVTSSKLPCINKTYFIREKETLDNYVLDNTLKEITLKSNEISHIILENEKIKGYLEITKIDGKNENIKLKDAVFGIYNENNELIQTLKTDENGKATSNLLVIGKYYLKELETGSKYYLLNKNTFEFEIKNNNEIIPIKIKNEPTDIKVNVEKTGDIETKPNEIVHYSFSNIANKSNTYLDSFKWFDYIPTDSVRIEKITTGTWNQELLYKIYYKINKSDEYVLYKDNLNSKENHELSFLDLQFENGEFITEFHFDFGKVDINFKEETSPTLECRTLDSLENNSTFINNTKTIGNYNGIETEANSNWTTVVHIPKKPEPVLPRTGK